MGTKGSRTHLTICLIVIMLIFALFPTNYYCFGVANAKDNDANVNFLSSVHFIDVGQGDCIFIEMPNKKSCIIDGGSSIYSSRVVNYIQNLGYSKIDLMIATHSDADHVGGLSAVLANFEVKKILRPYVLSRGSTLEAPDELEKTYNEDRNIIIDSDDTFATFINFAYKEKFEGQDAEIEVISNQTKFNGLDSFVEGLNINFEVVSPVGEEDGFLGDASMRTKGYKVKYSAGEDRSNEQSAVVMYTIQNAIEERRFLFMADANEKTEADIIARSNTNAQLKERLQDIDVLKVAHHGSKYGTTTEFLDLTRPKIAVISVGVDNSYGHPAESTMDRINNYVASENLFRTDMSGTVVIRFGDDGNLWAEIKSIKVKDPIPNWVLYLVLGLVVLSIVAIVLVNLIQRKLEKKIKPQLTEDLQDKNTEPEQFYNEEIPDENNYKTYETKTGQITLIDPSDIPNKKKKKE